MNIDSTRKGGQRVSLRSLFTAVLLMVVALAAILGLTSTKTLAAENNTSIAPDKATEVVLTSSATGDVDQQVTDADYAKLQAQYNVTPDGTPTILSKTQNVETLETKDGNKDKSYVKTTTKWVISDEDNSKVAGDAQETPSGFNLDPTTALVTGVPALLGGVVLGAVPALAAVPAAFLAGGVLPTAGALAAIPVALGTGAALTAIPAALTGAALTAIPAALTGAALTAIPAALTGAALNAIPAALTGAALTALPAFTAGVLATALPAFVAGAVANAIPAFTAGVLATLGLGRIALGVSGALHALANPLSFGGPLFRLAKGFAFPLVEITKDHIEDIAVPAFLLGSLAVVPAVVGALALLPLAFLAGGVIPALIGLAALSALPLAFLAGGVIPALLGLGALALAIPAALVTGWVLGHLVPLALLGATLAAIPAALAIAWALGHLVPLALLGLALAAIPAALVAGWLLGHLVPLALLGLALGAIPLALLAGLIPAALALAALPLAFLAGLIPAALLGLGALALGLPLAFLLGGLIPTLIGLGLLLFNPFFGTGILSMVFRFARNLLTALALMFAVLLPSIGGLLLGVLTILTPIGLPLILLSLVGLLAGLFTPIAVLFALTAADIVIQLVKALIRVGIILVALPIAGFGLIDGLLDSVAGLLVALFWPGLIGKALAVAYVFLNMTEVYASVVTFAALTGLELVALID